MEDFDKTIPPRREHENFGADDVTMPGKHDRKPDGRFAVGDLIMGRYKVLAELGQGGMGVVYKCFDETAGVEIALKALPPELSHNGYEMEDVKENFQIVSLLVHQNIAIYKNLEKDNSNGNYYLIMEYCDGEDLRRWMRRKRREGGINLETVIPVIQQIAAALDYAHKQKIIHRDIKPGNIMINAANEIKVLDFGLAAQIHTSMTRVSMAYHGTSGTGPYMAPEQWRGRAQKASADQYALAVLTYEMLAGNLPFESPDAAVLQQAVLTQEAEAIAAIPQAAQDAINRAMSKEPQERFATCADFAAALSGSVAAPPTVVAAEPPPPPVVQTFEPPTPPVNDKNKPASKKFFPKLVAAVSILLLFAIAGGGYYALTRYQIEKQRKAEIEKQRKAEIEKQRKAEIEKQYEAAEDAGVIFSDDKKSVVGVKANQRKKIVDVVIPEGVTAIANQAFSSCSNLRRITISGSVEEIGENAFWRCRSLQSVTINDGVKEIGKAAFSHCNSLRRITIPGSVEKIGEGAFYYCNSLRSITIPGSVEKIGEGAFSHCESLQSITIPGSVKEIGVEAFNGCTSLQNITIPGSVKEIGEKAFYCCTNLRSVTIPNSVKEIGRNAFYDCDSLQSITIPGSVEKIGERAFEGCTNLERVTINDGVKEIGEGAFQYCGNLRSVTIPGSVKKIGDKAFFNTSCENKVKQDYPRLFE